MLHHRIAGFPALAFLCICVVTSFSNGGIGRLYSTELGSPKHLADVKQFWKTLEESRDSIFSEEFEQDFLLILNDAQRIAYKEQASLKARKAYVQAYWRARDPNPLLPENLYLTEHVRRREYVRRSFSASKPPYYDDRGKYYLRFGEPLVRFQDPGGFKYVEALGRNHPDAYYMVRANESWSYENVTRDFVVHFAAEGQVFRRVRSLRDVVAGPERRDALAFHWNDIVKERAAVSPVLARAAMESEQIEVSLKMANFTGRPGLLVSDIVMPTERIFHIARTGERYLAKTEAEAPPLALEPLEGINVLALTSTVAQFKADRGRTRVEVTLYSPVGAYLTGSLSAHLDRLDVEYSYLFRDSTYHDMSNRVRNIRLSYSEAQKIGLDFVVGRFVFTSLPQRGDLTLQVRDATNSRIGFKRQRLRIRDFSAADLMVSDLQFYTRSDADRVRKLLPSQEIAGARVCSYPTVEVSRSKPLLCYFEVYKAAARALGDEYEVTYKLYLAGDESDITGASISLSYNQQFSGETSREMFSTDLSRLGPGQYEMEITVRAQGDEELSAQVSRRITIVE